MKMLSVSIVFTLLIGLLQPSDEQRGGPCDSSPCQNEGICSELPDGDGFVCACVFGFSGETCEIPSKCMFRHVIQGMEDTDDVDIVKFTGLDSTKIDDCKNKCQATPGCRSIEVKGHSCSVFNMIPVSIAEIAPMTSEAGRLFAIRRCFRKKVLERVDKQKEQESRLSAADVAHGEL